MTYPEFTETDMTLALEAAGYATYGPAEEQACKLANIAIDVYRKKLMDQEPDLAASALAHAGENCTHAAIIPISNTTPPLFVAYGEKAQIAQLVAAPMPQANESDAVGAPHCMLTYDEDTDAWDSACGEKLFFDEGGPAENGMRFCYACGKKITARAVLADEPLPQPDGPTQEQEAILQKLTDEAQAMGLYDAQPVQDEPCCANPRPDCMGMLLSGIGNRCAALAQAQASGKHCLHPTNCFDHANGNLCDDCLGKPQASGKAAPSDEDIIHIAVRTVPAFKNRDALTFARALLERYGNHE